MATPTEMLEVNEKFFLYKKISTFVHSMFKIRPYKEHTNKKTQIISMVMVNKT